MTTPIPVIDIFAGPGGLGEGFSALKVKGSRQFFKVKLSIEKDVFAHKTLELRAFYRQFAGRKIPCSYYEYLRGEITRSELFEKHPEEANNARNEAWLAELGKTDRALVRSMIRGALNGAPTWILIGGPPCQAYSLVGRSRMLGGNKEKYEKDERHFLYREYLQILADHQPPVFVMENVKGLLSAKLQQEKTFELILNDLQSPTVAVENGSSKPLSYRLFSVSTKPPADSDETRPEDFIVCSEDYGIPQARHRLIILGVRSDIYRSNPEILEQAKRQVSIEDVIGDLPRLRSGLSREEDSAKKWRDAIRSIANAKWLGSLDSSMQLASYAGTVPAVKSSGGKVRYGHTPKESNHYLKWAFVEAANAPAQYRMHPRWQHRHVTRLYERVKQRKGHSVAVGAVARHLAEATFWILNKQEPYREPIRQKVLPRQA